MRVEIIQLPAVDFGKIKFLEAENHRLILHDRYIEYIGCSLVDEPKGDDELIREEVKYDWNHCHLKKCVSGVEVAYSSINERYELIVRLMGTTNDWIICVSDKQTAQNAKDRVLAWLTAD